MAEPITDEALRRVINGRYGPEFTSIAVELQSARAAFNKIRELCSIEVDAWRRMGGRPVDASVLVVHLRSLLGDSEGNQE